MHRFRVRWSPLALWLVLVLGSCTPAIRPLPAGTPNSRPQQPLSTPTAVASTPVPLTTATPEPARPTPLPGPSVTSRFVDVSATPQYVGTQAAPTELEWAVIDAVGCGWFEVTLVANVPGYGNGPLESLAGAHAWWYQQRELHDVEPGALEAALSHDPAAEPANTTIFTFTSVGDTRATVEVHSWTSDRGGGVDRLDLEKQAGRWKVVRHTQMMIFD